MPVEPAAGPPRPYAERRPRPRGHRQPIRGRVGKLPKSIVECVVVLGGEVGAEVGCLHRAGTPAGHHMQARTGQGPAESGGVRVGVGAALDGMAAHHADRPCAVEPLVQRAVDRLVVQRHGEQFGRVAPARARPPVDLRIGRRRIVAAVDSGVQLLGRVEGRAVLVERQIGNVVEDQRAVLAQPRLVRLVEPDPEEQRAGRLHGAERLAVAPQVDALEPPAAHPVGASCDEVVELVDCVDVDSPPPTPAHDATLVRAVRGLSATRPPRAAPRAARRRRRRGRATRTTGRRCGSRGAGSRRHSGSTRCRAPAGDR
jgi:hypothetical protein